MHTYIHALLHQRRSHTRFDTHQISLKQKNYVDDCVYDYIYMLLYPDMLM